ncbi:MAG TPA: OsmC family peroxiredoxin [Bacteroidia bacterium]|jgi:osmotically inducible protein OsmC|nr:OsmC family peroxiredoxin [Bacteroidia bacterium]
MKRTATAAWNGSIKEGSGTLTTQSTTLNKTQYSFKSRFEEGTGTNPEELIAAAHAGCFTMKLSGVLGGAGLTPTTLETTCTVTLDNGAITNSHLVVKGNVPNCSSDDFKKHAEDAKANCPISKSLNTNITMEVQG